MKILKRCSIQLVALLGLLFLTACANLPIMPTKAATTTAPTATVMPSSTAAPTATRTRPSRPIATSTPRDPPTLRNTQKPTPLPPLLTTEAAVSFTIKMQETNGGCELPCWWSIIPGTTTAQDAAQILYPLKNFPGLRSEYGFHLDAYSSIDVGIYANKPTEPIEFIQIHSFVPFDKIFDHFDASWQSYFLPGLIAQLGKPSEVWIGFGRPTGDLNPNPSASIPFLYELFVFYSDLGIRVQYVGDAVEGGYNQACFSLDKLHEMRIFIQRRSAGPLVGPPAEPYTRQYPISEVANLSLEAFHERFRDSSAQACVESPVKFWH